ncbi:bile acid-CoA:amino acid N-acyltransferase-like [Amphiura filiformis]|uniref:bile acid-CoA:amino acid N-acyltransferase-like n=1 Tax=Amphiura filiformis TaxID=82378 RepID=UPI003B2181FF
MAPFKFVTRGLWQLSLYTKSSNIGVTSVQLQQCMTTELHKLTETRHFNTSTRGCYVPSSKHSRRLEGTAILVRTMSSSARATATSCVSLQASPNTSLMDEIVTIEVAGLMPGQPVTLNTYFDNEDKQFETYAHYTSDENGTVNTTNHASQGGNFIGIEPMGMFWSMVACPGVRHGTRYMKRDISKPLVIDISVHDGHLSQDDVRVDKSPMAATSVGRWYKGNNVELIKVEGGKYNLQGTLVKPKGPGPFPAVVDMFGGVLPGCNEIRAALLASHGFAALSLGYFWETEEVSSMIAVEQLQMEYFEEAVDWLNSQPYIQPGGIGTVGVCKGGEMATAMAIHFPDKIRATIGISTCGSFTLCPTTYKGKTYPYAQLSPPDEVSEEHTGFSKDGHICLKDFFPTADDNFQEFDRIKCPALIICGDNDDCVPNDHSDRIAGLIQNNGHDNPCEFIKYPGAGHLIEPPYVPVCTFSYQHPWGIFRWGGTPRDHAHACEAAWKKVLAFLQEHMVDKKQTVTSKL